MNNKPASSRFVWESGDLVFVDAIPPGLSRKAPWPKSMADHSAISEMATWVQERLPSAFDKWDEAYHAGQPNQLTKAERKAFVDAFNNKGGKRWAKVAEILASGEGSRRFVETVSELLKLGAFGPQANLTKYRQVEIARDRDLVEAILLADFPHKPPQSVRLMATKIAAVLLNPASTTITDRDLLHTHKQPADIQNAMRHRANHKDGLEYLCWRVAKDSTSELTHTLREGRVRGIVAHPCPA